MAKNLSDCNTFFIDSNVYIHISLDPEFLFNRVVFISSKIQSMKMSIELFHSLNAVLNNLNILYPFHVLIKEIKFMTIEQCNSVNILLIKCLQQDQNKKLTKENVKSILRLSDAIREDIQKKNMHIGLLHCSPL